MDLGQRLAIHLPGQQNLVVLCFSPLSRDHVIHNVSLLEVGIRTIELEMDVILTAILAGLETTAVLDDALETDAGPASCANCAFAPGCVDQLVAVSRVLVDLLNTASAGALQRYQIRLPWEEFLVLQVFEGQLHGLVNEAIQLELECVCVDLWDAAVVADEVVLVWGDLILYKTFLN